MVILLFILIIIAYRCIFILIKSLVSYQKLGGLEERIAGSHPFEPGSTERQPDILTIRPQRI